MSDRHRKESPGFRNGTSPTAIASRKPIDVFAFDDSDERVVLGNALAFFPEFSAEFGPQIEVSLFHSPIGKSVFAAICDLASRGAQVSTISTTQEVRARGELESIGGAYEITTLVTKYSGILSAMPLDVRQSLRRMREAKGRRMAQEGNGFIGELIHNPTATPAEIAAAFRYQAERIEDCQAGRIAGDPRRGGCAGIANGATP